MIMIFQLSDWFPKPMIWAIIIKFDQISKNWWRISCAEPMALLVLYISSYLARPRRITVNYFKTISHVKFETILESKVKYQVETMLLFPCMTVWEIWNTDLEVFQNYQDKIIYCSRPIILLKFNWYYYHYCYYQ